MFFDSRGIQLMHATQEPQSALLTQLLLARGPGGQEDEVRAICLEQLRPLCDETWVDPAGNVVGLIKGQQGDADLGCAVKVMAHMDEIAMVVKRVETDGTLRVMALGGANPINFGVCPVDILGDAHNPRACCPLAQCTSPKTRRKVLTCCRGMCIGTTSM
jgi:putative aminopeptidase FrvX